MNPRIWRRGWPLLVLWLANSSPSQTSPSLLADLNTRLTPNADSSPIGGIEFGNYTFYRALTARLGWRLWRTDLVSGVTDPVPPANGVSASQFDVPFVIGTRLVYVSSVASQGEELIVVDDPNQPVPRVLDIATGSASSYPRSFFDYGGRLCFTAYDDLGSWGLWLADATLTSATRIQVLQPAPGFPPATAIAEMAGRLYFTGSATVFDQELWTSDGTPAGTYPVADIHPGPQAGSQPGSFRVLGNVLYFTADDGTHGRELWRSDGTSAGTSMVLDLYPGSTSGVYSIETVGSRLCFQGVNPASGAELYVSDGTSAGTSLLLDFHIGPNGSTYAWFRPLGNRLVFSVGSLQAGSEPWITDGTPTGTYELADAWPGSVGSFPAPIGALNASTFLFATRSPNEGNELWRTDGSRQGTVLVRDIYPGAEASDPSGWIAGGRAYLNADGGTYGHELWVSDGTTAGTRLLQDLNPVPEHVNSSYPGIYTSVGSRLFFTADDGVHGIEPFVHDAQGTRLMADLNPGPEGSAVRYITPLGDEILFSAVTQATGYELWASDGTAAGTRLVRDIVPGSGFSTPVDLTPLDDRIVFAAWDGNAGFEPWVTDGTTAGTQRLLDIRPGYASSNPSRFARIGDAVYFMADDGTTGLQLWSTDGTTAGTRRVSSIGAVRSIHEAFLLAGRIVFLAVDTVNGIALWETDGTQLGTRLLTPLTPGTVEGFAVAGDQVYVAVYVSFHAELWSSDGTPAGTRRVHDFSSSSYWPSRNVLAALEDRVVFRVETRSEGLEPWVSDGTTAGTQVLRDIVPGVGSSLDREQSIFHAVDRRRVYFAARSIPEGRELWSTDGTPAGTRLVVDLVPGPHDGIPIRPILFPERVSKTWMVQHLGRTYLGATDGTTGVEPYVFFSGLASTEPYGRPCSTGGSAVHLDVTAPILGGRQRVRVDAIPPAALGVTAIGLPAVNPFPIAGSCSTGLDPLSIVAIDRFSSQAGGTYTSSFSLPNDPLLSGANVVYQSFVLFGTSSTDLALTESIHATFGL